MLGMMGRNGLSDLNQSSDILLDFCAKHRFPITHISNTKLFIIVLETKALGPKVNE